MSKIKIVGHASGTGVLTIAAPNTNTDRTITIPDVTGTLLDSGSDLPAANLTGTIASARLPTSTDLPLAGGTMTGTLVAPAITVGNSSIGSNASHLASLTINNNQYIGSANATNAIQIPTGGGINVTGAVNSTGEMRITNPSATSQLYLYGASGQKSNIILNEYGVRAWHIGAGTYTSGQFSISDGSTEKMRVSNAGVVTATSFVGSGSGLTGIDAATVSSTAPSSPAVGDLWFDTSTGINTMKVYNGSGFDQLSNKFTASGGTVSASGGYTYHTFTSSSNFVAETNGNIDYLIVGGGGSGGSDYGGGGGAGGLIYQTGVAISSGTFAVVIGGGGAYISGSSRGNNGSNSTFNGLTATGGGSGGGEGAGQSGSTGGSGGGGSYNTSTLVMASTQASYSGTGFGNAGGYGGAAPNYNANGGGGAGAVGVNAITSSSGAGGIGKQYSMPNATYYAGGGGGGFTNNGNGAAGAGGNGGGGAGAVNNSSGTHATPGTANTGGGGGGASGESSSNPNRSGAGGSGIVIVRYLA